MPRLPSANPQLTFNRAASATQRRPLRPSSSKKRRPASGPPRCQGTFPEAPLPSLQTPSNLLKDTDSIKVAVRVRPFHVDEVERGEASCLAVSGDGKYVSLKTCQKLKTFPFHTCLGPEVGQEEVMGRCGVYELLDAALDGFNVTIFAYGQTGSGKTYTLQENIGIIGRSLGYIFSEINRSKHTIKCSYCEIYNEALYDLINFSGKQLSLKWDHAGKTFYSPELTIHECDRLEEAEKIVAKGNKHRKVGSHALNIESSRSHAIFTVHIVNSEYTDHTLQAGKVVFVDLAGSERLKESHSEGAALRETAAINRSLFMLGKVISALSAGAKGASVPYRESKLTKLLMDALGGHSMTLMIACCSPSSTHADETLNTLNYAMRAKNIQNSPAIQYDPEHIAILSLRKQIQTLQSENAELRNQLFRLRQSTSSSPLVTASSTMLPLA